METESFSADTFQYYLDTTMVAIANADGRLGVTATVLGALAALAQRSATATVGGGYSVRSFFARDSII